MDVDLNLITDLRCVNVLSEPKAFEGSARPHSGEHAGDGWRGD